MEDEKKEKVHRIVKSIATFIVVVLISIIIIIIGNNKYKLNKQEDLEYMKATITSVFITEKKSNDDNLVIGKDISFEANLDKETQGKVVFGRQLQTTTYPKKTIEEGDKVILIKNENSEIYSFVDYDKTNSVIILVIAFIVLTIIVGLWKGFNTIVALILNALIIFLVYIPSIVSGANIYLSTTLLALYVVSSGLILLNGINKKTFAAIIGNICGVAIAGILAFVLNKVFYITGVISEESIFLQLINSEENKINLVGIIWAGTVIGALGAIMDTAMSVSSTIKEVSDNMENKEARTLFKSGMTVGRDAIGTMTNTLVLAYIGGAISMTILLVANSKSHLFLINSEPILVEILQAIVGSIGILITVPFTVLVATMFEVRKRKEGKKFIQKYSEGLSFNFKKK